MEYLRDGLQHQVKQVAGQGVPGGGGVVAQAEQVVEPRKLKKIFHLLPGQNEEVYCAFFRHPRPSSLWSKG